MIEFWDKHGTVFEEYKNKQFAIGILQIDAKSLENEQKIHLLIASNGDHVGKIFLPSCLGMSTLLTTIHYTDNSTEALWYFLKWWMKKSAEFTASQFG